MCAGVTWLAEWISGEHSPKHGGKIIFAIGWIALVGILATKIPTEYPPPDHIVPRERMESFGQPHHFTREEMKIALPVIKHNACLVAEDAVRYAFKPAAVGFAPCGDLGNFDISIGEDLEDISVSGVADVNEERKPFIVKLQHNPVSLGIEGMIVNDIAIDGQRVSVAVTSPAVPTKVRGPNVAENLPPNRLVPVGKMDFSHRPHHFTREEMKIALPTIRFNGCLMAQAAVLHALKPATVSSASCDDPRNFDISISENLEDISVSGVAEVNKQPKPFTVTMQHNPVSLGIEGIIIIDIAIDGQRARAVHN